MGTRHHHSRRGIFVRLIILLVISTLLISASVEDLQYSKTNTTYVTSYSDKLDYKLMVEDEATDPVFNAEGLHYEKTLTNIFSGNFLDIPFDRDAQTFVLLLNVYISTYARNCKSSLPPDRIQLTKQECASEREIVTKNGFGVVVGRRWECTSWRTVPTGLWASPKMYNTKMVIESLQAGDVFRNLGKMLTQEDPLGNAISTVGELQAVEADMKALLMINGCDSPGIKRFEENLRFFALNKPPIRLEADASKESNKNVLSKDQNFNKLVDDLVFAHSKNWVMNKYQRGSVSNLNISSQDNQDRPSEINVKYIFQGFSGQRAGSVRVTFREGLPDCLYFFDFPSTCRTADRRIVDAYANGGYQK